MQFLEWNATISTKILFLRGPINNIRALVEIVAWCWPGNKPLSEPMIVWLLMQICVTPLNELTHHGPVPHICVAIFSAYFRSAPDMWRWFQCSFPQCPIHGAWQTARSSPVPQIVVARPHLLSHQRPIYVARHGPLSLHVLYGKY